jgi:hypothetical protein
VNKMVIHTKLRLDLVDVVNAVNAAMQDCVDWWRCNLVVDELVYDVIQTSVYYQVNDYVVAAVFERFGWP